MDLILWLQSLMTGPGWERLWLLITNLYSEDAYAVLVPLVFWLADRRFARVFSGAVLFTMWLNDGLKALVDLPRPAGPELRVLGRETAEGGGFPSGHAQGPVVTWLLLAWIVRRRWFTGAALGLVLLIGFSRLYLGLHWPIDVLGGWAIGALLVWIAVALLSRRIALPLLAERLVVRIALAAAMPVLAILLYRNPNSTTATLFTICGAWLGFWVGSVLEEEYVGYVPRAAWWAQGLKVVLGLALLLGLRVAVKPLLPPGAWFTYARYAVLGVITTLVLPWLFVWLRLGSSQWNVRPGHQARPPVAAP